MRYSHAWLKPGQKFVLLREAVYQSTRHYVSDTDRVFPVGATGTIVQVFENYVSVHFRDDSLRLRSLGTETNHFRVVSPLELLAECAE